MSIQLDTKSCNTNNSTRGKCGTPCIHLLPCKIQSNSTAAVSQYFEPSIRSSHTADNKPTTLKASFRGRPLEGERVTLPSGYTGLVLSELVKSTKSKEEERIKEEERVLTVESGFSSLTLWNLDLSPGLNDKFTQALKWIDISSAIHCSLSSDNNSQASSITPSL